MKTSNFHRAHQAVELMFKNVFDSPSRFFQYLKFEHNIEKNVHFLIDEFQYIKDAGLFIKVLYDTAKRENRNITFVVSGSSSLEIYKNREFLTGRKVEFTLFPFSLTEALAERNQVRCVQMIKSFRPSFNYRPSPFFHYPNTPILKHSTIPSFQSIVNATN